MIQDQSCQVAIFTSMFNKLYMCTSQLTATIISILFNAQVHLAYDAYCLVNS